jgi:hypothetical protein
MNRLSRFTNQKKKSAGKEEKDFPKVKEQNSSIKSAFFSMIETKIPDKTGDFYFSKHQP